MEVSCVVIDVDYLQESNATIFAEKEMGPQDIIEKAKHLASLWTSTDQAFKGFPFSLVVNNLNDVIGC